MNQKITYNQTAFSADEPVYDSFGENTQDPESLQPQKPKTAQWKTMGLVFGVTLFVLSLLILLFSLQSGPRDEESMTASPTPIPQTKASPTQQRLLELQKDFEAADPAAQDLFFPPVNMELQLDSKL